MDRHDEESDRGEAASPLQIDLARRIIDRIRDSGWGVGTRISWRRWKPVGCRSRSTSQVSIRRRCCPVPRSRNSTDA